MSLTAAALFADLNQQLGPYALLVNLASAAAWAMREVGYRTADPMTVTDDDIACVRTCDINKLIAVARYGAAERVFENLDPVILKQASIEEDAEKLRRVWRERICHLLDNLKARYAYGLAELSEGEINFHFESSRRDALSHGWRERHDDGF